MCISLKIQNSKPNTQRGNAFILILLGIVLFAGLIFTISRGMRSQTTGALSERDAELAASEIVIYAQRVSRGVDRVRRKGCSENQISFENDVVSGYTNANAPSDNTCHVFHPSGGAVVWLSPANSLPEFQYWGNDAVQNIGTSNSDLLMGLFLYRNSVLCEALNKELGLSSSYGPGTGDEDAGLFTGSFDDTYVSITEASGLKTACFDADGGPDYIFYHVLLER